MPTLQVAINAQRARVGAGVFNGAANQIVRDARNAAFHLTNLTHRTDSFGDAVKRTAVSATVLLAGFSVIRGLQNSFGILSDFSREVAVLQGVTRATTDEMAALVAKARELGQNTIFTAPQAAEGLVYLSRAGFDANQSIQAIDATLNLATASMLDLATAANIVANTINQFDLSTTEASRVADVLVSTTNLTNTNMLELGQAMEYVGPVASALGKDLEETAAILGLLADRGIKASIAGTNLRGISAQLAAPLTRQKKVLDDLNLSMDKIDPVTNSFADAFDNLRSAGMGATEAVLLFGRRNFNAALVIAANTDAVRKLEEELRKAEGTTQRNADLVEESLFGAFRKLASALQDSSLALGERGLTGVLLGVIGTMTDAVKIFFNIGDAVNETNTIAVVLTETLRVIISLMVAFVAVKVGAAALTMASSFAVLATSGFALEYMFITLNAALGPAGWLVLGITALGYTLLKTTDNMKDMEREAEALQKRTEEFNKATEQLTGEAEKFEKAFIRIKLAMETFDLSGQAQQTRVLKNELQELLVDLIQVSEQEPELFREKSVDVANLRRVFGEAGQESLNAFLEEFAKSDTAEKLHHVLSPDPDSPAAKQRMKLMADNLADNMQGALSEATRKALFDANDDLVEVRPGVFRNLITEANQVTKIPVADAIRLVKERITETGEEADKLTTELEEFNNALNRVGADEILQEFLDAILLERELIGKTKDEQEKLLAVRKLQEAALEQEITLTDEHVRTLEEAVGVNQRLRDEEEKRLEAEKERLELEKQAQADRERATSSVEDIIHQLENQNALLKVEGLEREQLAASQQVNIALRGVEIENIDSLRDRISALVAEQYALNEAIAAEAEQKKLMAEAAREEERRREKETRDRQRAAEDLDELNRAVDEEINLLGLTSDAREIARKTAEFHAAALKAYNNDVRIAAILTDEFREKLVRLSEQRRLVQLADDIADSFGSAFEDVIFGISSVEEAFENMVREVARLLFQELVTRQLVSFTSGIIQSLFLPNAKGNIFTGGGVKAFAMGGVVGSPTFFPMSNGGTGLMGEAGPEAIVPLGRTSTGELGVKTIGGSGSGTVVHVHFHGVKDHRGFKENSSQIQATLARAVSSGRG